MKKIYKHRIKEGSYKKMRSILKYPQTGEAIVDNAICRITDVFPGNENYLNSVGLSNNSTPMLYQIKVYNSEIDAEAIILDELVEEIPINEWIEDDFVQHTYQSPITTLIHT